MPVFEHLVLHAAFEASSPNHAGERRRGGRTFGGCARRVTNVVHHALVSPQRQQREVNPFTVEAQPTVLLQRISQIWQLAGW